MAGTRSHTEVDRVEAVRAETVAAIDAEARALAAASEARGEAAHAQRSRHRVRLAQLRDKLASVDRELDRVRRA